MLLALLATGCASAPRYLPSGLPLHAEPLYLPPMEHLSLKQCKKRFPPKEVGGYCEWYGGADIAHDCQPGYHIERQWATGGFGAALIPTSRLVCHRDVLRGEATVAGLECASR